MESKSFNTTDDEKLTECVRNYPVLYKLIDKNYKDNSIKENAWKEISHVIGKNVNDCKTRWSTIRDSYKKNLKKRKLGTGSAAPTKSKYNDNALSFLENIEDERKTKSNIACNDNLNYSEVIENECFNQNSQSELEKISLSSSDLISSEKDTPIVYQPQEKETRDRYISKTLRKKKS